MPDIHIEITANTVAWYGAIVATAGIIVSIWNSYKDRARIKVKISSILIPYSSSNYVDKGFSVTISNFGIRPIIIDKFYLGFTNGKSLVFLKGFCFIGGDSGLPKTLNESESHIIAISAGEIARDILEQNSYPIAAIFCDSLGREYKAKTKQEFWENIFNEPGRFK